MTSEPLTDQIRLIDEMILRCNGSPKIHKHLLRERAQLLEGQEKLAAALTEAYGG